MAVETVDTGEPVPDEMLQLKLRTNAVAMLKRTAGKVSGDGGAAQLLGVKPTTLASRLRKWGIDPRDYKQKR
jgi:transcriptional regulator with GAF, ATPase, and Fis domain